jgi:hypothetical protein
VLVVTGVILVSLASCCGVCMLAGLVGDAGGGVDGRYDCVVMSRTMMGGMLTPTTSPSISFSIAGDSFSTQSGGGSVRREEGDLLRFSGSDMDGWLGTVSSASGVIYFRADPHERHPGGSAGNNETKCQRVR